MWLKLLLGHSGCPGWLCYYLATVDALDGCVIRRIQSAETAGVYKLSKLKITIFLFSQYSKPVINQIIMSSNSHMEIKL